jgi:hypothetical protein
MDVLQFTALTGRCRPSGTPAHRTLSPAAVRARAESGRRCRPSQGCCRRAPAARHVAQGPAARASVSRTRGARKTLVSQSFRNVRRLDRGQAAFRQLHPAAGPSSRETRRRIPERHPLNVVGGQRLLCGERQEPPALPITGPSWPRHASRLALRTISRWIQATRPVWITSLCPARPRP